MPPYFFMWDEIIYRLDMLQFWLNAHGVELDPKAHWLIGYAYHYPLPFGLVVGYVAGYYTEGALDWLERRAARRRLRKRIRENIRKRELMR